MSQTGEGLGAEALARVGPVQAARPPAPMEYRVEVVHIAAKHAQAVLNRLAAEGWRLESCFPIPMQPSLLQPDQQEVGLYCVFSRERG